METKFVNKSVRYPKPLPKRLINPKLVNDDTDETPINQRMQDINEKIKEAKRKFLETLEKRRTDKTSLDKELKNAMQLKGNGLQESYCAQSSAPKANTSISVEYKESTVVNDELSIPQGQVVPETTSTPNLLVRTKTTSLLRIHCPLCDVKCTREWFSNRHVFNFPHSSMSILKTQYSSEIFNSLYSVTSATNDIVCKLCNVILKCFNHVKEHVNGIEHVKQFKCRFPEVTFKRLEEKEPKNLENSEVKEPRNLKNPKEKEPRNLENPEEKEPRNLENLKEKEPRNLENSNEKEPRNLEPRPIKRPAVAMASKLKKTTHTTNHQGYHVPPKAPYIPNLLELNKPANTINSLRVHCSDCDCYCSEDFYYNQHLSNFPHSSITLLKTLYPADIVNSVYKIRSAKEILCIPCNVFMKSPDDVTRHLNGTKHAKKLNSIFPEFAPKNLGKPPTKESVPAKKPYCAKRSKLETSSQAAPKRPSASNLTKTKNTALNLCESPDSSMTGFQSSRGYHVPPKGPYMPNLRELNIRANTINSWEIHCSACDCYCPRDYYYNKHVYNFSHTSITLLKTLYPADIVNSLYKVRSANEIQCIPCNVFMKSPSDVYSHLNGTKHAMKLNSTFHEFDPKNLGKPPKRESVPAKNSYCTNRSKLDYSMGGFQSSHANLSNPVNVNVNGSWHNQYMDKFRNSSTWGYY